MEKRELIILKDDIGEINQMPMYYLNQLGNDEDYYRKLAKPDSYGEYPHYLLDDFKKAFAVFFRVPPEKLYHCGIIEDLEELNILEAAANLAAKNNPSIGEQLQKRNITNMLLYFAHNVNRIDDTFLKEIFSVLEESAYVLKNTNGIYKVPESIILDRKVTTNGSGKKYKIEAFKHRYEGLCLANSFVEAIKCAPTFYYDFKEIKNILDKKIMRSKRIGFHPIECYDDNYPQTFEWIVDQLRQNNVQIKSAQEISLYNKLSIKLASYLGNRNMIHDFEELVTEKIESSLGSRVKIFEKTNN